VDRDGRRVGSASFATPAIVLGSSAAAGAATTVIRSDATIAAFDATVPVTQAFGDAAATGSGVRRGAGTTSTGCPPPRRLSGGASEHAHVVSGRDAPLGRLHDDVDARQAFEPGSVIAWNTTTLARLA
jgi:hypothetical protein